MSVSLTKLTTDLNAHQNLPDQPTLTASELKVAWDKPSNDIKTYLNNILIPEAEAGYTSAVNESKAYTDSAIGALSFDADSISYDNTSSGLTGDTVQEAIDELKTTTDGLSSSMSGKLSYGDFRVTTASKEVTIPNRRYCIFNFRYFRSGLLSFSNSWSI